MGGAKNNLHVNKVSRLLLKRRGCGSRSITVGEIAKQIDQEVIAGRLSEVEKDILAKI
jgi:hypothetical protein